MDVGTKKRKKHLPPEGAKTPKKVRFSFVEELGEEVAAVKPTPEKKQAVVPASENGNSMSGLHESIKVWMEKQEEYSQKDLEALLEESENLESEEEYLHIEGSIKSTLMRYSDLQKRKSFKYECEWSKCKYMSGKDSKYFLHVELHAETMVAEQDGNYACKWDLCDFVTENGEEFSAHVHYHAYHTKLKVHGASIHMLLKLPSCNYDSHVRNTITNRPVMGRCEWDDCDKRFNKVMDFFHHVKNHVIDGFQTGRKYSIKPIPCKWSLCKMTYTRMEKGLAHIISHTTEREIACYNCGTMFCARTKYADHCVRQLDMSYRKYPCPHCERCYATKNMLNSHIENHVKNHSCVLCPLKFSSAGMLSQHMIRKHIKDRTFKCQQCEFAACTRSDLTLHTKMHSEAKIFRCEEFGCNVAFKSEVALKKHISWHYNLPPAVYECHICTDKRFGIAYTLSKHLQFVHKFEREPGHCRYRYKIDSDGVYRVLSYVEQKRQAAKALNLPAAVPPNGDGKDVDDASAKKRRSGQISQQDDEANEPTTAGANAAAYAPVKGKPKIQSIKSIGKHVFSIDLNMEPDTDSDTEQQAAASESQRTAAAGTMPKDVKDFTVMKRYLRKERT